MSQSKPPPPPLPSDPPPPPSNTPLPFPCHDTASHPWDMVSLTDVRHRARLSAPAAACPPMALAPLCLCSLEGGSCCM